MFLKTKFSPIIERFGYKSFRKEQQLHKQPEKCSEEKCLNSFNLQKCLDSI